MVLFFEIFFSGSMCDDDNDVLLFFSPIFFFRILLKIGGRTSINYMFQ